ncbi:MAG: hypothetical protein JWQ87_2229 [Candidatus Sulfotelmatobacter sp.]|nr:hypothetical protein [Candidatus Sulfotelmatobacter sp.]
MGARNPGETSATAAGAQESCLKRVGSVHDWIDAALGLGSIAGLFGSMYAAYRLSQRTEHEKTVQNHESRISRVEGFLEGRGFRQR